MGKLGRKREARDKSGAGGTGRWGATLGIKQPSENVFHIFSSELSGGIELQYYMLSRELVNYVKNQVVNISVFAGHNSHCWNYSTLLLQSRNNHTQYM